VSGVTSGQDRQTTKAAREWTAMVEAEHAQTARLRGVEPGSDHWKGYSRRFRAQRDHEEMDPATAGILEHVRPEDTLMDVGAGGGRLTIPIAQHCRHVVAVEPSEAMRAQLEAQAAEHGVTNITVVPSTWEEAEVDPVDILLCCHVMYAVFEPEQWVRKMSAHAKREVVVLLFHRPVPPNMHPLWEPVHGEKRLELPAMAQFEKLLAEMGIDYEKRMLPEREDRGYADLEEAVERGTRRLFLEPGSEKQQRLEQALRESLVETPAGLQFSWAQPMMPGLITWTPTG